MIEFRSKWTFVEKPPEKPGGEPDRYVVDKKGGIVCDADRSGHDEKTREAHLKLIAELPAFIDLLFEIVEGPSAATPPLLFVKSRNLLNKVKDICKGCQSAGS